MIHRGLKYPGTFLSFQYSCSFLLKKKKKKKLRLYGIKIKSYNPEQDKKKHKTSLPPKHAKAVVKAREGQNRQFFHQGNGGTEWF